MSSQCFDCEFDAAYGDDVTVFGDGADVSEIYLWAVAMVAALGAPSSQLLSLPLAFTFFHFPGRYSTYSTVCRRLAG